MKSKPENPIYNLGFNLILPIFILNKGQDFISSPYASIYILLIALSFPFFYGLQDFILSKKINSISLIGLIGIALTGGLAILKLEGIYFAIKEAAIPLILAIIAIGSVFLKKPLASVFIFKSSLFNTQLIKTKLKQNQRENDFKKLLNYSTLVISASFILSAILNFIIAISVFKKINPDLTEELQRQVINKQVADMTWMGYVFIALPLTLITACLMWWFFNRLKFFTGLSLEELTPQSQTKDKPSQ